MTVALILRLTLEHLTITALALTGATLIALPLSLLIAPHARVSAAVLGALNVLYTIPSLALMITLLPLFGLNALTVIVALTLYSQALLVRNLVAGLRAVDPAIREAARGMGLNAWQMAWRIELPLALPALLAGERIATVTAIAGATLGAKFNGGGLGRLLFDGIAQTGRYDKIWVGALTVALLAWTLNALLSLLERRSARWRSR